MTTTKVRSIRDVLNLGNANDLADAARKIKLGDRLSVVKVVVASLTATATPDITSAAVKAAATTIAGMTLESGENLPPIGHVLSLRCSTSGTAGSVGSYGVTDDNGTAVSPAASTVMGIAKLSDNGKVLTFPTTVTGFEIHYIPRQPAAISDLNTTAFAPLT